jgi:hypothetical protein
MPAFTADPGTVISALVGFSVGHMERASSSVHTPGVRVTSVQWVAVEHVPLPSTTSP